MPFLKSQDKQHFSKLCLSIPPEISYTFLSYIASSLGEHVTSVHLASLVQQAPLFMSTQSLLCKHHVTDFFADSDKEFILDTEVQD